MGLTSEDMTKTLQEWWRARRRKRERFARKEQQNRQNGARRRQKRAKVSSRKNRVVNSREERESQPKRSPFETSHLDFIRSLTMQSFRAGEYTWSLPVSNID